MEGVPSPEIQRSPQSAETPGRPSPEKPQPPLERRRGSPRGATTSSRQSPGRYQRQALRPAAAALPRVGRARNPAARDPRATHPAEDPTEPREPDLTRQPPGATRQMLKAGGGVSAEEQMTACQPFDALLRDESFLSAFHAFLRKEFSEENILFWKACEGLKKLDSPDELPSKAVEIYNKFIQTRAPKEINIDHQTKEVIKLHLQMPDVTCFDVAQKQIYSLMEKDSYPRFIKSEIYLNIVNKPK
ncbi:RGS2 protein, partial [Polypterus senegalus]